MIGIFLDTEASGLNPMVNKILEIAFQLIDLKDGACLKKFVSIISVTKEEWGKSDPMSLKVNGFTFEEVKKAPTKEKVAEEILSIFSAFGIRKNQAVFICQNPSFDRAFFSQLIDPKKQEKLSFPYHWLDLASMYWALCLQKAKGDKPVFPWDSGLSKDQIAKRFHLEEEEKPHRAMNGVKHLLLCYRALVGFPCACQ